MRAFWGYKLVVPHLTSACQSRLLSPFKVLPPVCRVFRVPWRCLRRKRMIAFIQTAYVAEDLAVLKFPDWERDVERSSKAVGGDHSPSPERLAKERAVWLRMKRGRHSAQEPFRGMPENVCRRSRLSVGWNKNVAMSSGETLHLRGPRKPRDAGRICPKTSFRSWVIFISRT